MESHVHNDSDEEVQQQSNKEDSFSKMNQIHMKSHVHDDSDEEVQQQSNKEDNFSKMIQIELNLLSPLLPLKYGNGFLLAYAVNQPGVDDKSYLLEVGLITGMTSLALVLLTTLVNYILKSAPSLLKSDKSKVEKLAYLAVHFNRLVMLLQVVLLLVIFFYTVSLYPNVDFHNEESPYYVKERIYVFSLLISSIMFFSILVAGIVMLALYLHTPLPSSNSPKNVDLLPHPASSVLPLGLANVLLGMYIGIPGDDRSLVGPKVFLLDLCLWIGAITVLMTVMVSVIRVAAAVALRDGHIDVQEATLLKRMELSRYLMAMLQMVMYIVMFCHSVEVFVGKEDSDYTCPRNLVLTSLILSSVILVASVIALVMVAYLKFC